MTRKINFGICFSRPLEGNKPLSHTGQKLPVYHRLLDLCKDQGWQVYVLTRKTYANDGIFQGAWLYHQDSFQIINQPIKIDLVYDRTAGVKFPPADDKRIIFVNDLEFKKFCWDKWLAYRKLGKYMPKTFWIGHPSKVALVLPKIKTSIIVLKPYNGLKGLGIYIGPKDKPEKFDLQPKYQYLAQEFVDTSKGIVGITDSYHDLRVVIVNDQPVWCHVRIPLKGRLKANLAQGGEIREVDYQKIPISIQEIVGEISQQFCRRYHNPIYSLDFGVGTSGRPYLFEINDQIGFPRWEMANRDRFLEALVANFKTKV